MKLSHLQSKAGLVTVHEALPFLQEGNELRHICLTDEVWTSRFIALLQFSGLKVRDVLRRGSTSPGDERLPTGEPFQGNPWITSLLKPQLKEVTLSNLI